MFETQWVFNIKTWKSLVNRHFGGPLESRTLLLGEMIVLKVSYWMYFFFEI